MKPLYIWAGGKNKMISKYLESPGIPLIDYDTYVEPFFGGGAMMIYIYENASHVKRFVMNDVNPELVGIYTAIKNDVENFKERMNYLEAQWLLLDKDGKKTFYYSLRDEYTQNWSQWNATDESATLYFLMKTSFNGIWQTTKTSNGRFATPVGLCKEANSIYDRDNVDQWHALLQKVEINCGDWSACVDTTNSGKTFFFMDPPYIDSFTSYGQVFDKDEQLKLLDFCHMADTRGDIVFFCNRDDGSDIWTSNQKNLDLKQYSTTYTAGRRSMEDDGKRLAKKATEVLLHSANIPKQPILNPYFFDVED